MTEAHISDNHTPYRQSDYILHFLVVPNEKGVDMASICGRCNLRDVCFGETGSNFKKAHIDVRNPRIRNLTSQDPPPNCDILPTLMAKRGTVEPNFFPKIR